jgi:hypothetical protein
VVTSPDVISSSEYLELVAEGVRDGKRLLAMTTDVSLQPLLEQFDLEVATWRLWGSPSGVVDPITINTEEQRYARGASLLEGVDEIRAHSAHAIFYHGRSGPFLVCPHGTRVTDQRTDFPVELGPREIACAGVWPIDEGSSRVVLLAAAMLFDDDPDALGRGPRGTTVNRRFAENLLHWLTFRDRPQPPATDAPGILHAIEVALHDIVIRVLKSSYGDERWWYDGIPDTIRSTAAQRHEEARGGAPKEAFIDLVDYMTILDKRWTLFQPHFLIAGRTDKAAAIKWITNLNEIRRRVAHPTRQVYQPLQPIELEELRKHLRYIQEVLQNAASRLGRPVGHLLH